MIFEEDEEEDLRYRPRMTFPEIDARWPNHIETVGQKWNEEVEFWNWIAEEENKKVRKMKEDKKLGRRLVKTACLFLVQV